MSDCHRWIGRTRSKRRGGSGLRLALGRSAPCAKPVLASAGQKETPDNSDGISVNVSMGKLLPCI